MNKLIILIALMVFVAGCVINNPDQVVLEDVSETLAEAVPADDLKPEDSAGSGGDMLPVDEEAEIDQALSEDEPEKIEEDDDNMVIVEIKNMAFVPQEITIRPGTTVIWQHKNRISDDPIIMHQIVIYPGGIRSERLELGDEFSFTFEEEQKFRYIDVLHKDDIVRGIVNVVG